MCQFLAVYSYSRYKEGANGPYFENFLQKKSFAFDNSTSGYAQFSYEEIFFTISQSDSLCHTRQRLTMSETDSIAVLFISLS